ncbi:MAG: hypothetical protein IJD95_03175 [Clostridia bacterium]|nr:hypothetical protein [Clostridia bacterium]
MKKITAITFIFVLLFTVSFSGCAPKCEHEWLDATCIAPKTCSLCEKTEGDALGHDWQEATCTSVKTCNRCAETEGELAPHDMAAANYQSPSVCTVCGHTEGEKLSPFYADKNVSLISAEMGKEYNYKTGGNTNGSKNTVGKLWWEDHEVFTSKEGYAEKDGYEWHTVTVKIRFNDDNAQTYGFVIAPAIDNYYSGDTSGLSDDTPETFTVNYNGVDHECIMKAPNGTLSAWKNGSCTYTGSYAWQVPVGFDGIVIFFIHSEYSGEDIFEMKNVPAVFFKF